MVVPSDVHFTRGYIGNLVSHTCFCPSIPSVSALRVCTTVMYYQIICYFYPSLDPSKSPLPWSFLAWSTIHLSIPKHLRVIITSCTLFSTCTFQHYVFRKTINVLITFKPGYNFGAGYLYGLEISLQRFQTSCIRFASHISLKSTYSILIA